MNDYELLHTMMLRKAAPECMVLLKQDGQFPLAEPCSVALFGNGARRTLKGGTGSGDVNVRHYTTIEEGLTKTGFTVTTEAWLNCYDGIYEEAHKQFVQDIKNQAEKQGVPAVLLGMGAVMPEPEYDLPVQGDGDTAIYVLSRISGEGSDRHSVPGDLMLTQMEIQNIHAANERYKKFILVLNVGGVVDLSPVMDVKNILLLSQPGMTVGDSLADVLLGKENPSGKLAATWASAGDYCKIGSFGEIDDTRYREGIYVGYRYFDTVKKEPLFPFGFGLSYTSFEYNDVKLSCSETEIEIAVELKNTGKYSGKDVVELYVSVPKGEIDQPYQSLGAFGKTENLRPGESTTVDLHLDLRSLASFHSATATERLESGDYVLRIGSDSRHTAPIGIIRLRETVVLRQYQHIGGTPDFEDWVPEAPDKSNPLPDNLPVFTVDPKCFGPVDIISYDPLPLGFDDDSFHEAEQMDPEERRYLCVGNFREEGSKSVIGAAGFAVPGAAGETTARFQDQNLPVLVMADGPAGLRLAREYGEDEDGKYTLDDGVPAAFADFIDEKILKMLGAEQKDPSTRHGVIHEQYCSAIPIGTALAQSWNTNLVEKLGGLVASEMDRFGVDIWLAPALNIQRSPLCGRNFEYYSEDPLISGKMAAAMTRGVQHHRGRAVSAKHFCCNNQETNRFRSNSIVSERALRDLYLRGFRILVEEAQPHTIMTSYNLLNGIHTSERADLNEALLRNEWKFEGLIISDWVTPGFGTMIKRKYPYATAGASIAGGNDIMMPGGPEDVKNLSNTNSNAVLRSAARVISMIRRLKNARFE